MATILACVLLDIRIDAEPVPTAQISAIAGFTELISDDLVEPHGFDFIDDDTLVVANRQGCVAVFDLSITARARTDQNCNRPAPHHPRQLVAAQCIRPVRSL